MIYLLLAVLSSALVSIIMRFSEKYIQNNMAMFMSNYAVCAVLAFLYTGNFKLIPSHSDLSTAVFLGCMSGILFLVNFVLLQKTIVVSGLILASTAMKLGAVLIPALVAVMIFQESPGFLQVIGILISIAAILLINIEKGTIEQTSGKFWVFVLLLVSGLTDTMINVYDKIGASDLKNHFLFYIFLAAFFVSAGMVIFKKKKISGWDLLFGILIALPNYFSSRFLLLALGSIPAVVVYPFYSVATMIVVTCFGMVVFRERISRQKKMALLLILGAMVLLNLS